MNDIRFSYFEAPITNKKPSRSINTEEAYNIIANGELTSEILQLRDLPDKAKKSEFKQRFLPYATFSGEFRSRETGGLARYTHLMCLDFDNVEDRDRKFDELCKDEHTALAFISPSGNGIKAVVETRGDATDTTAYHKRMFEKISRYYKEKLGLETDKSGSDITRPCFMSSDKGAYMSREAKPFDDEEMDYKKPSDTPQNTTRGPGMGAKRSANTADEDRRTIEEITNKAEETRTDIAPTYKDWVKLGFALWNTMGEDGREYFHRLCRVREDYNEAAVDMKYDNCKARGNGSVGMGSIVWLAKTAGIEPERSGLSFSDKTRDTMPELIKRATRHTNRKEEQDMMTLGTLTAISACLGKTEGTYNRHTIYPNLFLFLYGKASAGKGDFNLCKRIVMPIHKQMIAETMKDRERYQQEKAEAGRGEGAFVKPPKNKMLIIPANSSSTVMWQTLNDSNGEGLIFETEADTLADILKKDYADYSSGLRAAFHHERISYLRRKDNEMVEINEPKLSTALSGTPRQIINLINDTENGLFSRFMFYNLPVSNNWSVTFDNTTENLPLNKEFDNIGEEFYRYYKQIQGLGRQIHFQLTAEQQEEFNAFYTEEMRELMEEYGDDIVPSVRRMGVTQFRIAMILATLRACEEERLEPELVCTDMDFSNSQEISRVLLKHTCHVYEEMQRKDSITADRSIDNQQRLIESLPPQFTFKEAKDTGKMIGISERCVRNYINKATKNGTCSKEGYGTYRKITN